MILTKVNVSKFDVDAEVENKIQSGKLSELLLIVPTNRKIRDLKRKIISSSPGSVSGKIHLETIGTFSTNLLFASDNSRHKVLSEAAAAVLLKQSFSENELKYFSSYKKDVPTGTLERIKNVITEYKRHGISADDLINESDALTGSEKIKALDIAAVYRTYMNKCRELNVKEIGDVYSSLNSLDASGFEANFRKLYPEVDLVIIVGFDEFTEPEIKIINSASELKNIQLFISFDYYRYNPSIFSHLDKCYSGLTRRGFKIITDSSEDYRSKFRRIIREDLFASSTKTVNDFSVSVTEISALTREKEVELAAKEIKQLIMNGAEPARICVAFNLIEKYSPLIRDIFTVFDFPFNLTDRRSLSDASPVISIINFLEIVENDFYFKNIFRALTGGFIKLDVSLSNLLKVSSRLKIVAGYSAWMNILEENAARDDYENIRLTNYELNKAITDLQTIFSFLKPFYSNLTLDEFEKQLLNLIFLLDIPYIILNGSGNKTEENAKGLSVFLETVRELLFLLKLEYPPDKKFSLKFILSNLRVALMNTRFNIKEKTGYGVLITTLNEIRGLNFDYLFISGLCDGDLPTRYSPEVFFSGSYLRDELNHQSEERYHFYQSLNCWNKKLYLTYPLQEERQELVKSNFLLEFNNLFKTWKKTEADYDKLVYSKEELLQYIGKNKEYSIPDLPEETADLNKIKETISIDARRIADPFKESGYSGFIMEGLNEEDRQKLKDLTAREFSITQLETYAKCPYKYFAERILGLTVMDEPTEEIEALELGTLLHVILYEFYKEIHQKKIILSNADTLRKKEAEDILFKIAEAKASGASFISPLTFFEKEKILGISGNRRNSILFKFLESEFNNTDNFIPYFFEVTFGTFYNSAEDALKIKAGEINIRGKIDRIDIDEENNLYKVADYKLSGRKPSHNDLTLGLSLQLPLYMYAARELIKSQLEKDFSPAGAEIFSLKFKEGDFGKNTVYPPAKIKEIEEKINTNEELISSTIEIVQKYVKSISSGKFNLSTLEDRENQICRFCSFISICRIKELT